MPGGLVLICGPVVVPTGNCWFPRRQRLRPGISSGLVGPYRRLRPQQKAFAVAYCHPRVGWALLVTVATLSSLSLLLWAVVWIVGNYHARREPLVDFAPAPRYMQVTSDNRRRFCDHCEIFKGNRVYHASAINRCLPLWDHWCGWLNAGIYLRNVKAYVLLCGLLPFYALFALCCTVAGLCMERYRTELQVGFAVVAILAVPIILQTFGFLARAWWEMLGKNLFAPDRFGSTIRVTGDLGAYAACRFGTDSSAWDQGWRKNLGWLMGPPWQWLAVWRLPPIARFLLADDQDEDFPMAPHLKIKQQRMSRITPGLASIPLDRPARQQGLARRQEARFSGFEDSDTGNEPAALRRRDVA
ncbi:hypothetical protein H2203_008253 [Taxawa tesnikishii (nom. ined.)]|nr:hypothetical protein H2203_008253 [Dothideales sp. JES 119]